MRNWKVFAFFLVLIPFHSFCQTEEKPKYAPRRENHRNKTDVLGQKQGTWKYYNVDGKIALETDYVDDLRHGALKRYYPGEKIMRETEYQYGLKEGSYKSYYFGGQLRTEGEYEGNKRISHWSNWYSNGNMQSEGDYVNGLKDGPWKYYNHKGDVINTVNFIKGKDQRVLEADAKKIADKKAMDEKLKKQKALKGIANLKMPVDSVKK